MKPRGSDGRGSEELVVTEDAFLNGQSVGSAAVSRLSSAQVISALDGVGGEDGSRDEWMERMGAKAEATRGGEGPQRGRARDDHRQIGFLLSMTFRIFHPSVQSQTQQHQPIRCASLTRQATSLPRVFHDGAAV